MSDPRLPYQHVEKPKTDNLQQASKDESEPTQPIDTTDKKMTKIEHFPNNYEEEHHSQFSDFSHQYEKSEEGQILSQDMQPQTDIASPAQSNIYSGRKRTYEELQNYDFSNLEDSTPIEAQEQLSLQYEELKNNAEEHESGRGELKNG